MMRSLNLSSTMVCFFILLPTKSPTAWANQIEFPKPTAMGTCIGEFCTILSVNEQRGRVLEQYDRYASLVKVPVVAGKLKLVQGVDHVDYMSVGCRKDFAIPKKAFGALSRIIASIDSQPKDEHGLPETLTGAQTAMLSFYASVLKQSDHAECPFPELFRNALPSNKQ